MADPLADGHMSTPPRLGLLWGPSHTEPDVLHRLQCCVSLAVISRSWSHNAVYRDELDAPGGICFAFAAS